MRSLKAASGSRVRVSSKLAPTVLGVHSPFRLKIPFGTCMNAMRVGRFVAAVSAGVMASSMGRASVAPTPRRNVRRGIAYLKTTIANPPHSKWCALDDAKNDRRPLLIVHGSLARDLAQGRVVVLFQPATQCIGQQPLGEVFNEHVLFLQQDIAQARRPDELGAVGQGTRGIDRSRAGSGGHTPAAE